MISLVLVMVLSLEAYGASDPTSTAASTEAPFADADGKAISDYGCADGTLHPER